MFHATRQFLAASVQDFGDIAGGAVVAVGGGMLYRALGILLSCSTLLAGCYTTTQTCTNLPGGPYCSEPMPVPQSPTEQSSNDTGAAIVAVGAVITGIALLAVLYHRNKSSAPEPRAAAAPVAREMTYVIAPSENESDLRRQRMFVQAHISARAGRCEAVVAIGKQLAADSPSYHERYVADPTIAQCLTARRL